MTAVAVILGGGSGERLGASEPKAFLELEGSTLLERALRSAWNSNSVERVVAVVPAGYETSARELGDVTAVEGGPTRQASVFAALQAIEAGADEVVVCHDAARPFASPALFDAVTAAVADGATVGDPAGAVPVIPVADTVKRVRDGRVLETVAREDLVLVQTPQAFRFGALLDAHQRAATEAMEFTDDAALLEWAGERIRTVPGERDNIKITTPEDLDLARAIARARA